MDPNTDPVARLEGIGHAASVHGAEPLLRLSGITKSFGALQALRGANFDLVAGEVHALMGENGAGKSTLVKIISGVHAPDGGAVEVLGRSTLFRSPAESRAAGVAVVYQELSLAPTLSVAANLFLGREPCRLGGFVRKVAIRERTAALLKEWGFPLDPGAIVGTLPFAHRQMTEILKAVMGNSRILILDEPTSALARGEEDVLFEAVHKVTARGVGVVYVTHRLREVFRLSQRITVLRDGLDAGTYQTSQMDMKGLVGAIVGQQNVKLHQARQAAEGDEAGQPAAAPPNRTSLARPAGPPVLSFEGVSNDRLTDVDLDVAPGEILGLAGLIGSGRTEILETAFGLRGVRNGKICIAGEAVRLKNPADAIRRGVALVPEDRHDQGLALGQSVELNIAMPRMGRLTRYALFQHAGSRRRTREAIRELLIKASPDSTVSTLSGGNQQKVVIGKWRGPGPKLLLLDEPTVGVDVGAREEIYGVVRRAAAEGAGVLVVSSDFDELLILCDRFAVVVEGRVIATLSRAEAGTEDHLHHLVQSAQITSARTAA